MADIAPQRVAAIDCGTNSLRLLVADGYPGRGQLVDLHRRMEIVRLGQGVDATGKLAPEALGRTFAVLEEYERIIAASGARQVRMVATSATRDASNSAEFTAGVRRILGVDPEVVTGDQEARLSFNGATADLEDEGPHLVVDIGGGSTEFVLGMAGADEGDGGLAAISMNLGSVRLTERYLHGDPPSQPEVVEAMAEIDAALDTAARAVPVTEARTLVGVAGSVTTVTAVALGLDSYDPSLTHHARIAAERVHEIAGVLLSQDRATRARNPAIHPGRVDVIAAGALILDRVLHTYGFAEMVASEHDLLDGVAWSLLTGDQSADCLA
jgi:exopolyphosphatase/guanosine-5'-triphosphate,3'-diphosphate pyrophosphatase